MSDATRSTLEVRENRSLKVPPDLAADLLKQIGIIHERPEHPDIQKQIDAAENALFQFKPIQENWSNKGVPAERRHLVELLGGSFSKLDQAMMHNQLHQFETRAWANAISKGEIAQTYSQISKILSPHGPAPVSEELRKQIARETIRHCANPEIISQGEHNTCNVTAIQVRTYSLHPAKAAKLIADIATTGEYTTLKGIKVKLDRESMRPDSEALNSAPDRGERDYATQLFNLAAVNVWYSAVKPGTHYEQRIKSSSGNETVSERVTDYSHGKPASVIDPNTNKPLAGPHLSADQVAFISDAIVGRHEPFAVLTVGEKSIDLPGAKKQSIHAADVMDESYLERVLRKLKDQRQLPAIACVDTNVDPLNTDSGSGMYGPGGGHVINVTDFQSGKKPRLSLDNEWSTKGDHLDQSVTMHDLYLCMGGSDCARLDAYANTEEAHANGQEAPNDELNKIRLDGQNGYLKDYANEAADTIKHLAESERKLTGEERTKWFQTLQTITNTVASSDKVGLLRGIRIANVCSNHELGKLFASATKSIAVNKSNAIASRNNLEKQACIRSTTKVAEYLATLPTEIKKHYFAEIERQ